MLLHGIGTGPEAWRAQVEAFGTSRSVITPRLRLDERFTIEAEAARLWELTGPEAVDLCGLSLGALVALRAALDEPGRVRGLALCAGFSALPLSLRALQAALSAVARLPGLDRATVRTVFREGRRFNVSGELGRLTMPVLVLVGERDRANRRLSKGLARRLPTAELRIVSGAGHVANVDAPEAFNEALRSFLEGAGGPPRRTGRPSNSS